MAGGAGQSTFSRIREAHSAEPCAADPAIHTVQDVVPITIGYELRHRARSHAAPVGVPATVPAVDRDLALGGLVTRVRFGRTIAAAEVFEENRDRIEPWSAGDHQLRHSRALSCSSAGLISVGMGRPQCFTEVNSETLLREMGLWVRRLL